MNNTGRTVTYDYSNTLLLIDLSKNWSNDTVILWSTPKPKGAPRLRNSGIWVDEKIGTLYTGFCGTRPLFARTLVIPDGAGGGSWKNFNKTADEGFVNLPRPFQRQVASGQGYRFFLGGVSIPAIKASSLPTLILSHIGFIGNDSGEMTTLSTLPSYNLISNKPWAPVVTSSVTHDKPPSSKLRRHEAFRGRRGNGRLNSPPRPSAVESSLRRQRESNWPPETQCRA
ncbi:hypothetical protein QBC35DRAFT_294312 [Podospora australis]|uniref:Uncharacterized protein n=1 Tax=Podospora australis TaxID=1536484 RepID=A0AAN7AK45_9PEZI|nr:hypothetical protein QBC35DRAFT_294312 [Podospora australis]